RERNPQLLRWDASTLCARHDAGGGSAGSAYPAYSHRHREVARRRREGGHTPGMIPPVLRSCPRAARAATADKLAGAYPLQTRAALTGLFCAVRERRRVAA